jgi:peptide/nickel transport system permease protein
MLSEIIKRILYLIPITLAVIFITFIVIYSIPGNPAEVILDIEATKENVAALEKEMGLDQPLYVQYVMYINKLLHGNLGYSYRTRRSIAGEVRSYYPNTIILAVFALVLAVVIGGIIGIVSALRPNSYIDFICRGFSVLGISVPEFWFGFILILFFAVFLRWFPSEGKHGISSCVLPAITLSFSAMGTVSRLLRNSLLEILHEPYIRAARAKGASNVMIVFRHALKNAMIPAITVLGFMMGRFLGGAVVVETVFNWPGMGRLAVDAILGRDIPLIQATILILALTYIIINLIVDLLYLILDPRIRYH